MSDVEGRASKEAEAMKIVHNYMGWTAGAGLLPLPGLDLAGITLVQLKMLQDLSKLYDLPFSRGAAKSIIGALVGGGGSYVLAPAASSLVKVIPVIGSLAGAVTLPAISVAATYALGKVFIQHFESGGTFLDFNPEEVRRYFDEQRASADPGRQAPVRRDKAPSSAAGTA